MRAKIIAISLFFTLLSPANAQQIVRVGGYDFPPFVDKRTGSTSLTFDLIAALNAFQKKYHFEFVDTSSKRRFINFDERRYDLIFFEAIDWGWQGRAVEASDVIMHGGTVYVTRADKHKDQRYFDDLKGKTIWGILGYHYGFANFNSDYEYLKKTFNAHMTTSQDGLIEAAVSGRADISVVVREYLQIYLIKHPEVQNKILVSKKFDAVNQYTILVRKGVSPDVAELNRILMEMENAGILKKLWGKYNLK
ncbi:transporter substrate-binding domain-containing protein [Duganella sp. FT92W]|uniref:Transporter substrate-binding domain-containing protein n=1 Tax=Pseudoduganella rivuli TaxID=2666085 RepID=A0A7X2LVA8_9BURK|nr:ABC transporter substrate-binding protein [Pseudoduganella rivuli]MRV73877.1 transporter substrate-binding domain-containing protein [Pseudoduganella rivuli]